MRQVDATRVASVLPRATVARSFPGKGHASTGVSPPWPTPLSRATSQGRAMAVHRFSSWFRFERPVDHWLSLGALTLGVAAVALLLLA